MLVPLEVQFRFRGESELNAGKRLERQPFFAHLGPKVVFVPLPIGKSALKRARKSGEMLVILLMHGTLPFMSPYVALPLTEKLIAP